MIVSTAHEIEKICKDANTAAIDVVKGVLALKSGAVLGIPKGKVLSIERDQYDRVSNAWIKYPDSSRLHYWKDKQGVRGARALHRKPKVSKPHGLALPPNFLSISTTDDRVTLMDSQSDWMHDMRRVGNHSATVYRLLAAWLHAQRPIDARYLKIRTQAGAFELAQRIGFVLTPITYRQKLIGFEYKDMRKAHRALEHVSPPPPPPAKQPAKIDDPCA